MKLVLHDLEQERFAQLFPGLLKDSRVISEGEKTPRHCVGCFGCWVKTPGTCVIPDGNGDYGRVLAQCTEYVIVSRIVYGGFSPFVKTLLDRNIGYLLPFFTTRNGEMHHSSRYPEQFRLTVLGYGEDATEGEQSTFRNIVKANALNLNVREHRVYLAPTPEELAKNREVIL